MKKRILFLSFILLSQAIPLSAMHHKKRFSRKTSLVKPSLITLVLLLTLTAPVNGTVEGNGVLRSQEEYWKKSAEESRKRLEDEIIRRRMADDEARRRTASNSNPFHGDYPLYTSFCALRKKHICVNKALKTPQSTPKYFHARFAIPFPT